MIKNIDIDFLINKCPIGLVVFDKKMTIIFQSRRAASFLKRFELPSEVQNINKRIFASIEQGKLNELFPGEIFFAKRFEGSPSNWIFRFYIYERQNPLVYLLIVEETVSNKLNMNEIRKEFRLTRRENDVLRRVLDGLKNVEIAEEFEIAEQTVKDHLSNIYMKTGAENRMALIRMLLYSSNNQTGQ